jgi:Tol biopolymer transport system component/DNA-binding winged helix-turn-helix (wHTH) protein
VVEPIPNSQIVRFGTFEVDLRAGELRKNGTRVKLTGQPFQILVILLEHPGDLVTREQLQRRLWPSDTFVDFDRGLNAAINRVREALGDSAENPRFVETLPRRGYRFIAQPEGTKTPVVPAEEPGSGTRHESPVRTKILRYSIVPAGVVLLAGAILFFLYRRQPSLAPSRQRVLTRLTFDEGLQFGATWSPDSRFIAYSSDRGGKFDIWVQQISGGDPVRVTKGPGHNWQPDWSPDGNYIAYRSENGEGGLFIVPALGGEGLERRIASFGYQPRWSPDGSQILFQTSLLTHIDRFYVVDLNGSAPREILAEFFTRNKLWAHSAAWHPDGKRISIWGWDPAARPNFWTVSLAGGIAVKSEIAPEMVRQLAEVSGASESVWAIDVQFSWAPSGKAIYFERSFRGAKNLWKMTVDPNTLKAAAIERLTTGTGPDTQLAVSSDGRKLAFTGGTQHIRAWLFPFDASSGRITGKGEAVTSAGMEAWRQNLSRDGRKLAFCAKRAGKWELWEKSLVDGREAPIVADDYHRNFPVWAPDGTRLSYVREKYGAVEPQFMVWSGQNRNEEPLTASSTAGKIVYDWSADGTKLLVSQGTSDTDREEVWLLPVGAAPHAEAAARKAISDPDYDLYQPHFSPDGRWIVFEAVINSARGAESTLYTMPSTGGRWTRITAAKHWSDKPRWSPDGKAIYFVSGRSSFFNVWGIQFDSSRGKPVGEPFRVTAFESPSLMVPRSIADVELSLNQDKLVLTMQELSGSIWVLDNVETLGSNTD